MHVPSCKCGGPVVWLAFIILTAQAILAAAADKPSEESIASETPDSPYETQTAQCTITSGDIEASAQASISKTLVGVCGTDEMLGAFQTLELKLLEEIHNLRRMIRDPYFNPPPLRPSVFKAIKRVTTVANTSTNTALPQSSTDRFAETRTNTSAPSKSAESQVVTTRTTTASSSFVFPDSYEDEDDEDSADVANNRSTTANRNLVKNMPSSFNSSATRTRIELDDKKTFEPSPTIDFKPIDKPLEKKFLTGGLRDYEVYRFNNTVISSGDAKVFKYFWKIESFMKRVRAAADTKGATFSSAVFVISGLNLRLHAKIAKKPSGEVLYVQLEQLSAFDDALRKTPNVILASGALYGQVETTKFFRHKIMILNQDKPFSDLISTDLTNTNAQFEAPLSALTAEPYLKDDKLLVKVIIFL